MLEVRLPCTRRICSRLHGSEFLLSLLQESWSLAFSLSFYTKSHGKIPEPQQACQSTATTRDCDDDESFSVYNCGVTDETKRQVTINGTEATINIDTGADVSVFPSSLGVPVSLRPSLANVQAWGRVGIPVLGKAKCDVKYKGKEVSAEFVVVELNDNLRSLPLFSLSLSRQLGMVDELLVNSVKLLDGFDDLFNGIGCLNTGFVFKKSLNDSTKPRNITARRLPPALMDAVHHELERMKKFDIIRPITEPTEWSPPSRHAKRLMLTIAQ